MEGKLSSNGHTNNLFRSSLNKINKEVLKADWTDSIGEASNNESANLASWIVLSQISWLRLWDMATQEPCGTNSLLAPYQEIGRPQCKGITTMPWNNKMIFKEFAAHAQARIIALGGLCVRVCVCVHCTSLSLVPRPHPQEGEGLVAFERFLGLLRIIRKAILNQLEV